MKRCTVRPLPLRFQLLLPVAVLGVASILATACAPSASVVVSNVQNAICSTVGTGITCRFTAFVQVNNYTFTNTTATFVTTDLLVGQWTPQSTTTGVLPPNPSGSVAFVHEGVACTGPETTLAVYDGFIDTGTLVASTQLNPPVSLVCQ